MSKLIRLFKEEEGQGMTEYAVILGLIVVIAVTLVVAFGTELNALFARITARLTTVG